MIRAVLSDMDGVLCDSERAYMKQTIAIMRQLGYHGPDTALHAVIGTSMRETYRIMTELLEGKVTESELRQFADAYYLAHPVNYRKIRFPGVKEAFEALHHSGIRLACCSSSPKSSVDRALREMEIRDFFDQVISAEDVVHPKPDPEMYLKAAEALGMPPEECAVYEDSPVGIEAGKRAGMRVIARRETGFRMDQSQADELAEDAWQMVEIIRRED
ncbi:HAD family phosphatase [Erysipelotrichaceae bacterium Oil+RF-744-GAM-WT-6]|uniref:HAD family phosphatase n=1 Tax=Stecheria intestinalis TaxID=2606630 RepID=A0A7X2NUM9_9FIRM|nr:HAD family phosphatase [Stecheria intestinalis]MSS59453.1 HAD family phosphatase [Stecheria intestinalis]